MKEQTKKDIKEHALKASPIECCGFVVSSGGAEIVVQGYNISEQPRNHFILSAESYIKASSKGDILSVYHSHLNKGSEPSQADITSCERIKLPWIIYSLADDSFNIVYPTGKKVPLLGREFVWGVHDCFTLARDYYEELGLTVFEVPYEERFWQKGLNLYEDNLGTNGFFRVPIEKVQKHDLLLFCVHSKVPNHAGVYVGDNKMLHHLNKRLSCRDMLGIYWRNVLYGCYRYEGFKNEANTP